MERNYNSALSVKDNCIQSLNALGTPIELGGIVSSINSRIIHYFFKWEDIDEIDKFLNEAYTTYLVSI